MNTILTAKCIARGYSLIIIHDSIRRIVLEVREKGVSSRGPDHVDGSPPVALDVDGDGHGVARGKLVGQAQVRVSRHGNAIKRIALAYK